MIWIEVEVGVHVWIDRGRLRHTVQWDMASERDENWRTIDRWDRLGGTVAALDLGETVTAKVKAALLQEFPHLSLTADYGWNEEPARHTGLAVWRLLRFLPALA